MSLFGVSLALPASCGEELQSYRVSLGDQGARGIPAHITLMPPQELEETSYDDAVRHLSGVAGRHAPYRVRLRGTGSFRPTSPVVFVSLVEGITACSRLARDVCHGLRRDEERFPYHPHVTIAHGLADHLLDRALTEKAGVEAAFEVPSFWLYRHAGAAGWQQVREFALAG